MSHLTFLLILVLTILLIATSSYCAPDDPDSDDKCDFDRLLRCIQNSRGARDITSKDDSGAPNDRIFPKTSVVSKTDFSMF